LDVSSEKSKGTIVKISFGKGKAVQIVAPTAPPSAVKPASTAKTSPPTSPLFDEKVMNEKMRMIEDIDAVADAPPPPDSDNLNKTVLLESTPPAPPETAPAPPPVAPAKIEKPKIQFSKKESALEQVNIEIRKPGDNT
jgi:hypothetical protein